MKAYLIIVTLLLIASLGYGVYVWYVYQRVSGEVHIEATGTLVGKEDTDTTEGESMPPTHTTEVESGATNTAPLVLTVDSLTPTQQAILKSLGQGDARVVVDEALLTCVREGIGASRLEEVIGGAAPTPFEAMKIATCL